MAIHPGILLKWSQSIWPNSLAGPGNEFSSVLGLPDVDTNCADKESNRDDEVFHSSSLRKAYRQTPFIHYAFFLLKKSKMHYTLEVKPTNSSS